MDIEDITFFSLSYRSSGAAASCTRGQRTAATGGRCQLRRPLPRVSSVPETRQRSTGMSLVISWPTLPSYTYCVLTERIWSNFVRKKERERKTVLLKLWRQVCPFPSWPFDVGQGKRKQDRSSQLNLTWKGLLKQCGWLVSSSWFFVLLIATET